MDGVSKLFKYLQIVFALPALSWPEIASIFFADNISNKAADDRTHKANHILETALAKFAATKSPGATVVIVKSIAPFGGRLKFKQYTPGKSHKYGMKIFENCAIALARHIV